MKYIMIMLSMCCAMLIGFQQTTATNNVHTDSTREITVQQGDTLWDIASRSAPSNVDVREMVYALNQIADSGALVPGTKIKIPNSIDSPVRAVDYMAQN